MSQTSDYFWSIAVNRERNQHDATHLSKHSGVAHGLPLFVSRLRTGYVARVCPLMCISG